MMAGLKTHSNFSLPINTRAMEAKLAEKIPTEKGIWQHEPKWDGFRCLAFKMGPVVDLRAKSGKSLARYFPELVELLRSLKPPQFIVDGEILIELSGEFSFAALQMRLHPAETRIRKLAAEMPAQLMLFDMLADTDGQVVMELPLSKRRAALEAFVTSLKCNAVQLSPATVDTKQAAAWLKRAGIGKIDGVIAKQLAGPYRPGERAMMKVKRLRTADCVVGGFRYLAGKPHVGSLLLGLYNKEGKLDHVGFTSTITEGERAALTRRLETLRQAPGFTGKTPGGPSRWSTGRSGQWEPLRPELVVEVCFDHVTGDRFRHGTKILRWRPDKSPWQCTYDQIKTRSS